MKKFEMPEIEVQEIKMEEQIMNNDTSAVGGGYFGG